MGSDYADSEVQESEMDREGFDGEAWVKEILETKSLEELMRTYNSVLTGKLRLISSQPISSFLHSPLPYREYTED